MLSLYCLILGLFSLSLCLLLLCLCCSLSPVIFRFSAVHTTCSTKIIGDMLSQGLGESFVSCYFMVL